MKRRVRRSSPSTAAYLKPGALALLRDTRISARSHRHADTLSVVYLVRTISSSPTRINGSPCFSPTRVSKKARFPQRNKVVAAKKVYFLSPTPSDPAELLQAEDSVF